MRSRFLNLRSSRSILLFSVCLVALVLAACSSSDDDESTPGRSESPIFTTTATLVPPSVEPAEDRSAHPWKIVVSMPIFADMARIIGGDQVTVTTLIPVGVNPHTYVPTEAQIAEIQDADLVFVNGLGLDQPTIDFIDAHRPGRPFFVVDIVRNVPSPTVPQPPDRAIYAKDVGDDPHLWLDPVLVPLYAETISHSLIIIDGLNEPFFHQRYLDYLAQVQQMDRDAEAAMLTIPEGNRSKLITEHNSLIHFARRYGLEVAATLGEEGEATVQQAIAELSPPAVFVEGGPANDALTLIAGGAGIEVCTLYTDLLTDPNMGYLQMMEHNIAEIARCLGG